MGEQLTWCVTGMDVICAPAEMLPISIVVEMVLVRCSPQQTRDSL